jgi:exopolysaccharide production protein ExoY
VSFEPAVVPVPRLLVRPSEIMQRQTELVASELGATIDERSQPAIGGRLKRVLDIVTAATALVLLAPLMLIVSLLIYWKMGRPIFFAQKRIGLGGVSFPCFKFRTMVNDAEAVLAQHLEHNPEAAREWLASQKLRHDPRITTLGRLLRQSSIDELPQLFSVLQGNMSCVGPRPIVELEVKRYGSYWRDYKRARPGLTGVWQVSGRNRIEYKTRIRLDRWYVRRWSIWLDLWLLARTIPAVTRFDDTT